MLNSLSSLIKKRGLNYVNKLFDSNVTITEKLDTYRILFENVDGELKFFKKDNSELNLVERVLTNIWEDAIIELSIILAEADLPKGFRFGLSYTPVNKPIRLIYENLPKYILTDVTKREKTTNRVVESFDYTEVTRWAARLNLARPPIIFEGILPEKEKQRLIKYGTSDYKEDQFLQNIFGKSYSEAEIIEGIIIKNRDQLIQVESFEFSILNENYQKIEGSRDFYDLTLLQINSFLESSSFASLVKKGRYLDIICEIFNQYCESGNISEGLDPKFLTPPSFGYAGDLNLLLIENKKTISILEKGDKIHESVFKIMLSSFRKYKKAYGLLRESDVQKFNAYVYFINEISDEAPLGKIPMVGKLNEVQKHSNVVKPLNENRSDNVVIGALEKRRNSDVDNMRVISSIQKAFKPNAPELKKGNSPCVVYVTDPQPLTISQEENIKNLQNLWKAPIVLAFVEGENRLAGDKFHISDDLKKAQIKMYADNNQNVIPSFFSLESWDLVEIFKFCRPKYEPIAVIVDDDKKSEFVLQLYFEDEIMGGRLNVQKDFNIGEIENKDALTASRAIEDNKFNIFKELTPDSIWGLYDSIISEYKKWNGSVPSQFETNSYE